MDTSKRILFIAMACHGINAAYCLSMGDTSQVPWHEAPEPIQASAIAGVKMHLDNPNATPEQSHQSWMANKLAEGWKFGPIKDMALKEHPCLVPYDDLPQAMKVKDFLFKGTVHVLSLLPEDPLQELQAATRAGAVAFATQTANAIAAGTPPPMPTPAGFLPITYIGKREHYVDGAYGTKLPFIKGQTRLVPRGPALSMLKHPDVYVLGATEQVDGVAVQVESQLDTDEKNKKADLEQEENDLTDTHRAISTMNRRMLANFAKVNFNHELNPEAMEVGPMRDAVKRLIDQFGMPKS